MKKIRLIKNNWYDWLINYIPQLKRKSAGGFKDIILSLLKKNKPKQTFYGRGKILSKTRKQNIKKTFISEENKKIKDRITRDIRTLFEIEEEKEELQKTKKQNQRLYKDKTIRDVRSPFEEEEKKITINLKE